MKSLEALEVQCTCLPKIATTENGRCYQPYTRGPCEYGLLFLFIYFLNYQSSYFYLMKYSIGPDHVQMTNVNCRLKFTLVICTCTLGVKV